MKTRYDWGSRKIGFYSSKVLLGKIYTAGGERTCTRERERERVVQRGQIYGRFRKFIPSRHRVHSSHDFSERSVTLPHGVEVSHPEKQKNRMKNFYNCHPIKATRSDHAQRYFKKWIFPCLSELKKMVFQKTLKKKATIIFQNCTQNKRSSNGNWSITKWKTKRPIFHHVMLNPKTWKISFNAPERRTRKASSAKGHQHPRRMAL